MTEGSTAVDRQGMVLVPGGTATLGSERFYPEERPLVEVTVGDVWFDVHPVTNAEFAAFVEETGHVTVAEVAPDPADFPGADPALLVPGSQVFTPTAGPVRLDDWTQWWRWQPGASWRAPQGPGSDWREIPDHPVVHVGWGDASAYARWAGKELPSEAEFEHAARGGLVGRDYAWGDELMPGGARLANTWQGAFPWRSDDPDGHHRTSPVGSYPANGHGLHDLIGNVWEWTSTRWTDTHSRAGDTVTVEATASPCCGGSIRLAETDRFVSKGGSHLCSPHYCQRYRPAARQGHGVNDTTSHVGFRCVRRA
ncbi:formylglycine-generating enzyme family protein [Nocardioides sp. YIM 152315]|uniref:formylglycine-generating enzyme family protein n=1 Tax=Nocardioides sp. YIM 152315 TaxID=3031760 RepID=UPI0023DABCE7|nr:formylglycine-generating enzyme family protein [Nocardioides sp. YIM 152315]MDF1604538.1 formylglycine-generating enzyme family protein [Nocardioides sp. YIM 152315]